MTSAWHEVSEIAIRDSGFDYTVIRYVFIYVYMYVYAYIYMYIYVYICKCIYTSKYIYTCIYIYIYICIYFIRPTEIVAEASVVNLNRSLTLIPGDSKGTNIHMLKYIRLCVYTYINMYPYIHIYICIYTFIYRSWQIGKHTDSRFNGFADD
jgi:hypothetical protein